MNSYPADLRYTKEHEWCRVDGDTATVGITAYAVERLGGEITLVELGEEGAEVRQDEPFGTIESVKAAAELFAPVSGSVSEVNEELGANPEMVAESPYGEGWMLKIHMSDKGELGSLMDAAVYGRFIEETEE
jgi:glycine cleavage system H protein